MNESLAIEYRNGQLKYNFDFAHIFSLMVQAFHLKTITNNTQKNKMMGQSNNWNKTFQNCGKDKPIYDDWLDKYLNFMNESKSFPIIDLGCGYGNDTLYLTERGYQVISCDFSIEAIKRLMYFIKEPKCILLNMSKGLPFNNNSARVLIADLSIHYFLWDETVKIINEISRVLLNNGIFLCRINSVRDVNHGAGQGDKIEENYYSVNGMNKRFFDKIHLIRLFKKWEILYLEECEMKRYKEPKIVWEIALKKDF